MSNAGTPAARLFDPGRQTRSELRDFGRSLRQAVKRSRHADWVATSNRPDPVGVLRAQDAVRVAELVPIRYGRMLDSPFTFFRGSAAVMARDLAATPSIGVNVQACGDAHIDNFGVYATPERHIVYDVNDFDETLPGPWEWDLKRLCTSLVLEARDAGWGDSAGLDLVGATVSRYQEAMAELADLPTLETHYAQMDEERFFREYTDSKVVKEARRALAKARKRTTAQAARKWVTTVDGQARFIDDPPLIARLPEEALARFHRLYNEYRSTLQSDRRHVLEQFRFRDAARKVVGVGSVGLEAYMILLEGRGPVDDLILQVKQAESSVLTPYLGPSGYERHGQRVVEGQRMMQSASDPFLGWAPAADRDFYVRQIRDKKGKTERASSAPIESVGARVAGGTLARAHARSVDPGLLRGYLGKSESLSLALQTFSLAYADQTESDYEKVRRAAAKGLIPYQPGV